MAEPRLGETYKERCSRIRAALVIFLDEALPEVERARQEGRGMAVTVERAAARVARLCLVYGVSPDAVHRAVNAPDGGNILQQLDRLERKLRAGELPHKGETSARELLEAARDTKYLAREEDAERLLRPPDAKGWMPWDPFTSAPPAGHIGFNQPMPEWDPMRRVSAGYKVGPEKRPSKMARRAKRARGR